MKNTELNLRKQNELYNQYIRENIDNFFKRLVEIREQIDSIFAYKKESSPLLDTPPGIQNIHDYPYGFCVDITRRVLTCLTQNIPEYLKQFQNNGGYIGQHWGIYQNDRKEKMFHSILQIGTTIVDVCHEEPSKGKEQIHIARLNDPHFKKIRNLMDYAEVRESYHFIKACSTIGLLNNDLIPVVPMIFMSPNGTLFMMDADTPNQLNWNNDYAPASDFLREKGGELETLPEHIKKNFHHCIDLNISYEMRKKHRGIDGLVGLKSNIQSYSHRNVRNGIRNWHKHFVGFCNRESINHRELASSILSSLQKVINTYNALRRKGKLPNK